MSNYILDNTASDINTALGKVLSPDTSPTATDALITSGGVKTYVDTEVSAVNSRIDGVDADIAGNTNIVTGLTSAVSSTGSNRVQDITLDIGSYLSRDTGDELLRVDYVLIELWVKQGNNDSVSIRSVTLEASGAFAAVSYKNQSYTSQSLDGTWILHEKLWVPTLGLSTGVFDVSFDTYAFNDDWYIRAKATHFVGGPA